MVRFLVAVIRASIPFSEIEAVCLDLGGTLVTMDFDRLSRELERLGISSDTETLRRAEAAARPGISAQLAHRGTEHGRPDLFTDSLSLILAIADPTTKGERAFELASRLAPVLLPAGESNRFWSRLAPGATEFLEALRRLRIPMAVVSNSDGTAERALEERGLRDYFKAVIDSHVVGFAKPDPGIFDLAIRALGSDPGRTLHVGDIYAADVTGARRAGLHAVLLDPYGDWPDADCARARTLAEVAALLAHGRTSGGPAPSG